MSQNCALRIPHHELRIVREREAGRNMALEIDLWACSYRTRALERIDARRRC
jgi:hypothetical protein